VSTSELLTLEPLLDAVRHGVERAEWTLSGLQKTTSHEFEGRWAGEATRSAYLFFHREDLPESVSVEAFLDETSRGLRGTLSLVLDGPRLGRLGPVREVLARVAGASGETLPGPGGNPVSLKLTVRAGPSSPEEAEAQIRVKLVIPVGTFESGHSAVADLAQRAVGAFEALLERPEVAELLPPVVD
jgi:hypothetical protein